MMILLVAVLIGSSAVLCCNEPVVGASVVYDAYSGQAVYFGGESCADASKPAVATASNYICAQPCTGEAVEYVDASGSLANSPPPSAFQCCALEPDTSVMHCLGGVGGAPDRIFRFDVRTGAWLAPVAVGLGLGARTGHACAFAGRVLFVSGGVTLAGQDVAVPFFSFDARTGAVTTDYPTAPAARHGHVLLGAAVMARCCCCLGRPWRPPYHSCQLLSSMYPQPHGLPSILLSQM
ncbi:hypothetical protein BDR26DRAFT_669131 [Obelidium mucronatum]|nr:hypothetical protein BDR26DRAFT_669131 [Obelidium mucronatum]